MTSSLNLIISIGLAYIFSKLFRWYRSTTTRLADVRGPPTPSYVLGNLAELERSPMGTKMVAWRKKYGHTYKIRGALMEPWLIMGDPRGASYVLQGKNYVRPDNDRLFLELLFGKSLFAAEGTTTYDLPLNCIETKTATPGEEYRKMRKHLNPAFTQQSIQEISHIFFELADNLKNKWDNILDGHETAVFDIAPMIHMLSLDAISMTMFMHNVSASKGNIPTLLQQMSNSPHGDFWTLLLETFASLFPYVLYLPSPIRTYANTLRTEFGKIAEEVWAGKEGGGMHAKVIDALSQDSGSEGPISKEEAISQIIGIMFAGSETTANVIIEALYELSRNATIQQKLRDEISAFQATRGTPGYDDLMSPTSFPYLDAVVREALRTKAVLREIGRMALHDDVIPLEFPLQKSNIREISVRAGQVIQIPIRDGINVDEDIWGPDAASFRPERWIEPLNSPPSVDFVYAQGRSALTFGDGPKACLGRTFAIAEIKIVLVSVINSYLLEDSGVVLDFFHLSGNTVKPLIRGQETDGVQLPLRIRSL